MRSTSTGAWLGAMMAGLASGTPLFGMPGGRPFGSSFGVPSINAAYDYVVVGGGTAGLTLAQRLVEQQAGSVAVIEAGTFYELSNGNLSEVPAWAVYWNGNVPSDYQPMADWGYVTTPQKGANNMEMHYPRGKSLGGSSARNYMIYHRPTKGSMDRWAEKVGDKSYSWDQFLPWMEKSITFIPENKELRLANASQPYSVETLSKGTGPLKLTFANWVYAFPTWASKAMNKIGIPFREEGLQDGGLMGHAYSMYTIDPETQIRASSSSAFLEPALEEGEPDYTVYPLTMAKKIIFDSSKKATGVQVDTAGAVYTLSARKEVILAAGAIGSPQLLQVSGVGPKDVIKKLGVPQVAELAGVGKNFQDQLLFGVSHPVNLVTASSYGRPGYIQEQEKLFNEKGAGSLSSVGADMTGWEKVPAASRKNLSPDVRATLDKLPADWPELEYIAFSGYGGNGSTFTTSDPGDGKQYATFTVVLVAPLSRGSVTATSKDTSVAPAIDPAYLTHKGDVEVALAGFKRAREFWASDAIKPVVLGGEAFPGANFKTDEQIIKQIRGGFQTIYHGSCTCAMGTAKDPMAVIDTQARVYGVKGLRVVDASSFPMLPPGHPQSIVYALAEKIACDISGKC
jgi:choline dehydrogenase